MRSINSPSQLNALEKKISEHLSVNSRHVAIVGAGDGRLARQLQELCGKDVKISLIEPQVKLHRHLDDFKDVGSDPWDLDWYEKRVKANGPFDSLIFYQIHNYWKGNLSSLKRIISMLGENSNCWITFLNGLSRQAMEHFLPPKVASYGRLTHPIREAAKTDYASWSAFLIGIRAQLDAVWGLLDKEAYELCQDKKLPTAENPVSWDMYGLKLNVQTIADAYLWGASNIGLNFHLNKKGENEIGTPQFSGTSYSPPLFQALLNPYPETDPDNGENFSTQIEVDAWNLQPEAKLNPLGEFLLEQVVNPDEIKKVLIVGAGWGKDLILFRKSKPDWEFTGIENVLFKVEASKTLTEDGDPGIQFFNPEEPLPFQDEEFDITLSLGYFSTLYSPLAKKLADEILRVTKSSIYHLEDSRGPEFSLKLIQYSLKSIYDELGRESNALPVLQNEKQTGLYLLIVSK
jgi:ubiquinone/menaquinone biosynthesis C-methylase UbiE